MQLKVNFNNKKHNENNSRNYIKYQFKVNSNKTNNDTKTIIIDIIRML